MKKQLLKSALIAVAGVGLLFNGATANTLPDLSGTDFVWSESDYWSVTDLSSGLASFELRLENPVASYESSFGIYANGDETNKISLFSGPQEPSTVGGPYASVYFQFDGTNWQVSTDNVNFVDFASSFGFYSSVTPTENTFYTDKSLNDDGVEHFAIAFNSPNIANIYFEDVYGRDITDPSNTDQWDMLVVSTDITPVPEPATMLLFGAGVAGLAGFARRKKNS